MLVTRHSFYLMTVFIVFATIRKCSATTCLACSSFKSNEDCNSKAILRACRPLEVCENKVTTSDGKTLITKGCAGRQTCTDYCRGKSGSSMCKACCQTESCNQALLAPLPPSATGRDQKNQGSTESNEKSGNCALFNGVAKRCVLLKSKTVMSESCIFWCKRHDHVLRGSSRLICVRTKDGSSWSGSPPTCEQKSAVAQHAAPRSCKQIEYDDEMLEMSCTDKFNFKSTCTFRCKDGYYMVEPNNYEFRKENLRKSVCWRGVKEPAVWTAAPPHCMSKKCPVLVREEYSMAICTSWIRVGSVCDFSCLPGFYKIGPRFLSCLDVDLDGPDAFWNDTIPTCEPRECPRLNLPSGIIFARCTDGDFFRSECQFICGRGYYMTLHGRFEPHFENKEISKCKTTKEEDMAWRPSPPSCNIKMCPNIFSIQHGNVSCTNENRYMSTCTISCFDAFLLTGTAKLLCIVGPGGNSKFGVWDSSIPWCRPKVCEPLAYDMENTDVFCTDGIKYGTTCTFTCKVRYFMTTSDGQSFIASGESQTECVVSPSRTVVWSEVAPMCHLKSCRELSDPANGRVSCTDESNHGSRCGFSCFTGYVLQGRKRLTCQDTGTHMPKPTWNFDEPWCKPKPCPALEYNQKTLNVDCTDSISFRSICTFVCKTGYYMPSPNSDKVLGNSAAVCILNEASELEWSASSPSCLLKACVSLSNPHRGKVVCTDGTNYSSVCVFTCDSGYEPDGEAKLRCTDDGYNSREGVWSNEPPPCIRRSCSPFDLDLATTGFICDNDLAFESRCDFHCMEGHYLARGADAVDFAATTCSVVRNNMVWNESLPECKLKACPAVPQPERGLLRCNNANNFGSACMFMCSPGFYLLGNRILQCEDNGINDPFGTWNHEIPTCERKPCPAPDPKQLETIPEICSMGYLFESKCNYSCVKGQYMSHKEEITNINKFQIGCGVSGRDMTWSSDLPKCTMKTCTDTKVPENGDESCSHAYNFGSTCSFTCQKGYVIKGDVATSCQDSVENRPTGNWSHDPPICEPRLCKKIPFDAKSLTMTCSAEKEFKSVCEFSCQTGYYAVEKDSGNFTSRAIATCTVTVADNMEWSHSPPDCRKKNCEPHPDFANGKIACSEGSVFESSCSFECLPGFQLVGEADSTCIDTDRHSKFGNWSKEMPVCKPRPCPRLQYDQKTAIANCSSSNLFQSVCEFGCIHGYYMTSANNEEVVDMATTQCDVRKNKMYWSEVAPKCLKKRCSKARKPEDGKVSCNRDNFFQSSCFFSCSVVRELKGNDTLTCGADDQNIPQGQWDAPFPTCELRSCPDWKIDSRAIVQTCTNSYKYGSECTFSCNVGFFVPEEKKTNGEGVTTAGCGITGTVMTWLGRPPACEIKTCDVLTPPVDGSFDCSDGDNWDTRCTFKCAPGYLLIGERVLRCEDDGNDGPTGIWNRVEPTCEPRSCELLNYDKETQEVECSFGIKYGSVCSISCLKGYYLTATNGIDQVDDAFAVCDVDPNNKREVIWDHDRPQCLIKTCPDLQPPPDGLVECESGTTFGSKCMYKCLPGFKVVGLSTTTCKDDGQNTPIGVWSKDAPACKPKSCARLVNNADIANYECTDGWKYRSICTFTCNRGYFITEGDGRTIVESGEKSTECGRGSGEGMAWTHQMPNCLRKYCLAIRSRKNMTIDCTDKFKYNSVCNFSCDPPLRLMGPPVMTCIDDEDSTFSGKWDGRHWSLRCKR